MEMKKMPLGDRVYALAKKYDIEQNKVHIIITAYTDYCKEMLYNGYRVDLIGLASLIPDRERTGFTTTLAYECRDIAKQLSLPNHTVYVIVQEYLNSKKVYSFVMGLFPHKKTELYKTVKYNPAVIIVKNGEIYKYIDANMDEYTKLSKDKKASIKWIEENVVIK